MHDSTLAFHFESVVFDDGVREQLFAHGGDRGAGRIGILFGQGQFDDLALADVADARKAEAAEGQLPYPNIFERVSR